MERQNFDFEEFKKQAANHLKNGDTLWGEDGMLMPLLKEFFEGELVAHIDQDSVTNRKNLRKRKIPSLF